MVLDTICRMPTAFQKFKRVVVAVYLIAIHIVLFYFVGESVLLRYTTFEPVADSSVAAPAPDQTPVPTPLPVPEAFADQFDVNANVEPPSAPTTEPVGNGLMIPVAGIKPEQLIDTFSQSRTDSQSGTENRFHDAIDIAAPAGTPVVAASDGEIARFWDSKRGGITIYQYTADRKFILYYAHLQRRADEITVGMNVKRGATIGYVGDTGNAGLGNFHLHFSMARITDPKRFWEGTYVNPYPLLITGTYPDMP